MKPSSLRTTLARPELVVHNYSRTIAKQKPRIRVIHVVEPEVIETDAENFQELVQRLTGKQVERKGNTAKSSSLFLHQYCSKVGIKTEPEDAVKKENEEIYDMENGDGILSFLEELDGFFVDMNELPLLSCRAFSS